jgi:dolichol-phosphate mannosyltransferase
MSDIELSVVVPIFNEQENLEPLCSQIKAALDGLVSHETVVVDDGSSDDTRSVFAGLRDRFPDCRMVCHPRNAGQSAGLCSGIMAARGTLVVTLDGDLQNDPADIPKLLATLNNAGDGHWLIAGNRAQRHDSWIRRVSSRVANRVRNALLHDDCPDTGCSLKLFRRDDFLLLPQFDHMHRFLPALFAREGVRIINVPVNHRPRVAGVSKYGLGNRLWVGIVDLFGVRWLLKRRFNMTSIERIELARQDNHE